MLNIVNVNPTQSVIGGGDLLLFLEIHMYVIGWYFLI